MSFLSKIFMSLVLLLAFSNLASADPIRIVSGTASTKGTVIDFSGETSSVAGSSPVNESLRLFETNYALGSTFNFTPISFLSFNGAPTIWTTLNLDGTTHRIAVYSIGLFDPPLISSIVFTPTIQSFQLPLAAISSFSTQVPFTMQTSLKGLECVSVSNSDCKSLPDTDWYGDGSATYNYNLNSDGKSYRLETVFYVFAAPSPEPTPEPATLLLLGTGLAGIIGYTRRLKRKRAD